jgi:hypothetical protein
VVEMTNWQWFVWAMTTDLVALLVALVVVARKSDGGRR